MSSRSCTRRTTGEINHIENLLLKIFISDFAFFGYELDEFLAVAKNEDLDDPFHKVRQWARVSLSKKFFPYREKFHENECDETYRDPDYDQVPE